MTEIWYDNGNSYTYANLIYSPGADAPALRKEVEWAEEQEVAYKLYDPRRKWRQDIWAKGHAKPGGETVGASTFLKGLEEAECGSAFCIAGNACHKAGATFFMDPTWDSITHARINGTLNSIAVHAQALFRINSAAADALFASNNTAEEVRVLAEAICGEKL